MKKRHGWTADSKMPDRYVHLVNADVDDAIFEHHGIKTSEETTQKLPKQCTICDSINAHDSKNCHKCGKALDIKTAIEQEEKEAEKKDEELKQIRSQLAEMQKIIEILQQTRPKAKAPSSVF